MRVLVSVDLEGVSGVVDPEDIAPGASGYERACKQATAEAAAAVRGALRADPQAQVVVADAHAHFRNLHPELLPRECELIRGGPRPLGMLSGADATDAVVLIGYHAAAGAQRAVLAHTVSGSAIREVRLGGRPVGEIGLALALSSELGAVPVLVSGDDVTAREASACAPGITTVVVKQALGNRAARSLHPEVACQRIEAATADALGDLCQVRAVTCEVPVELEVDLLRPIQADRAALLPGLARVGPMTVRVTTARVRDAYELVDLIAETTSG